MSDDWGSLLYPASFGGVKLDLVGGVSTNDGPTVVAHTYAHVPGADLEDMGREQRKTSATIIFLGPDQDVRLAAFLDQVNKVKPQLFVHPFRFVQPYLAKVTGLNFGGNVSERNCLTVSCSFDEDTTKPALYQPGPGTPILAGSDEVDAAGADVVAAFEALEGATLGDATLLADTSAASASWADAPATASRAVNIQLQQLTDRIDAEMVRLDVARQIEKYSIMAALVRLAASLRAARAAFGSRTPRIIEVIVHAAKPLVVLAAEMYGARSASDRVEQLVRLNEIHNPLRIEKGTVLRAQAPNAPVTRLRSPA